MISMRTEDLENHPTPVFRAPKSPASILPRGAPHESFLHNSNTLRAFLCAEHTEEGSAKVLGLKSCPYVSIRCPLLRKACCIDGPRPTIGSKRSGFTCSVGQLGRRQLSPETAQSTCSIFCTNHQTERFLMAYMLSFRGTRPRSTKLVDCTATSAHFLESPEKVLQRAMNAYSQGLRLFFLGCLARHHMQSIHGHGIIS